MVLHSALKMYFVPIRIRRICCAVTSRQDLLYSLYNDALHGLFVTRLFLPVLRYNHTFSCSSCSLVFSCLFFFKSSLLACFFSSLLTYRFHLIFFLSSIDVFFFPLLLSICAATSSFCFILPYRKFSESYYHHFFLNSRLVRF